MEFLKQWTVSVCVTLVISVIFSLFTPKGKMKSFYKILISLFIFVSFLYPFTEFNSVKGSELSDFHITDDDKGSAGSYELMLENSIKNTLDDNSVSYKAVNCTARVENGEITVEKAEIVINKYEDAQAVKALIYEELGINAAVNYYD